MNSRTALSLALVVSGLALAQPANDTCDNALVIPTPVAFERTRSQVSQPFGAALQPEAPIGCSAAPQSTVWYAFTPAVSGRYELSACQATNPGATATDYVMAVYGGPCNALALVTNGCNNDFCSTQPRVVTELVGGQTYRVQIGRASTVTVAADNVQLSAILTSGANSCEGPVPDLPLDTTVWVATVDGESNDAQVGGGAACYVGAGNVTTAATLEASRRDRVHRFTAPRDGTFSFRAGASIRTYDVALHLSDSCVAPMVPPQVYTPPQCIAASNRFAGSTTSSEEISCVPLTQGQQVYLWVDEGAAQTTDTFGASLALSASECTREVEPNETMPTASPLSCGMTGYSYLETLQPDGGVTRSAGDIDYFALGQPQAGDRLYAMIEVGAGFTTSSAVQVRVTTATDIVEFDNNDVDLVFGEYGAGVGGTPLTAVPHYLRINHDSTTGTGQPYRVYSVIQPGTPIAESEPNDTPGAANTGATNYFSGTTTGTTAATFDVDFFAFQAEAGDLVYLSIDSQPTRSGSTNTANHTLALWDSSGQLLLVDDGNATVTNAPNDGGNAATSPAVPSEHLVYRVANSGTYWARVSRSSVTATATIDYVLSISLNCSPGGGLAPPTITSVAPDAGSSLGGETVTITGSNFGGGSRVTFDGIAATVVDATRNTLVVRTPVGTEGPADVAVVNFGQPTATLTGGYEYVTPIAPPVVTGVSPAEGPLAGGQTLTITGQLFKPGAEVRFDVNGEVRAGTNVNVNNLTRLTVTAPAHVAGNATVTVRNTTDSLEGSLTDGYRFNSVPTVTAVSPVSGVVSGGTTVTITGTGFRPGALVRFGLGAGANVVVDPSGTSLTTVSPPTPTAGPVEVIIINPDTQQASLADGFRFVYPMPTLTSVAPASGASAGGTVITLGGTNFFASPTVLVNGEPAVNVTRVSATQVTAVTPPGTPGVVSVALVNTDGQLATQVAAFAYVAPPTVSGITPARGSVLGNTRITITGVDLQQGASVRIRGSPAINAVTTNATTITALTPAGVAGTAEVEVTNRDGQRGALANAFTYESGPRLDSLTPVLGATIGGTVVTLTGSGFVAGTEVLFGTLESPTVSILSATQLTAVAPAAPTSVVSVSVRTPDSQTSQLSSAFRYVEAPVLTAITPTSGDVRGGTVVRVTGSGLGALTAVRFGGVASPLVTLVNPTTLDAVTPAGTPGIVDVTIANPDGAEVTLAQAFTYTRGAPAISAVAPASGPTTGGTMLTISGSGFAANVTVQVGGVALTEVVMASPELLRGRVPAREAGMVDVVVTNDDGQSATATNAYTYVTVPSGNQGIADGGNGGLGEAPDAGTTPTKPTGCGCSGVEGSALMFAALGLLLRRRRATKP